MGDGGKNTVLAQEKPVRSEWTTPVLVACGTMTNVLNNSASGNDSAGLGNYTPHS